MHISYNAKDICAVKIEFDIEDEKVKNLHFAGGCDGNHKALTNLVEGMNVNEVAKKLQGITCGHRKSSCPDQLAQALLEYMDK